MTPKAAILQDWHETVWQRGETERIPDFLAPDFAASGILPNTDLKGPDFPELVMALRDRLKMIEVALLDTIEDDDTLAAIIRADTASRANGRSITTFGQVYIRFHGDKFRTFYSNFDFTALFEGMSQLPRNSLALLLTGARLR